jgi:hypothetical protein
VSNALEGMWMDYQVTSLPLILYAGLHSCMDIPEFSSFHIPKEVLSPIEIRLTLYDKEGCYVELNSQITPAHSITITKLLNLTPLRMLQSYLSNSQSCH